MAVRNLGILSWNLNNLHFQAKSWLFKETHPTVWVPKGNDNKHTRALHDTQHLFQVSTDHPISLVIFALAQNRIKQTFVNHEIKESVREVHRKDIHSQPLNLRPCFFVTLAHLVNNNLRVVNADYCLATRIIQLLREKAVATTRIQNFQVLVHACKPVQHFKHLPGLHDPISGLRFFQIALIPISNSFIISILFCHWKVGNTLVEIQSRC
mmetsp:Transcript_34689/g.62549  ORF Transcript_34689/g.62549 Transcript_34689/m.62549 type:complete len:210 (-) Transcript_34689:31-660(-)